MEDVFSYRDAVIAEYGSFSRSFTQIKAPDIAPLVKEGFEKGLWWPDPLLQINPNYKKTGSVPEFVKSGLLHPECGRIFQAVNAGLIFPFKSGEIFPVLAKKNYAKPTAPTFRRPFIR